MATWAIGDVHGCLDKLRRLWAEIGPGPGDRVVFLGDLIDRGPDSRGVLSFVREANRHGVSVVALRGNHEQMCLDWHTTRAPAAWSMWRTNGGRDTLESYGVPVEGGVPLGDLPPDDIAFLASMPRLYREGAVVFVHAGLRPGVPLERQDPDDLIWIRDAFYRNADQVPHRVVFGHTPFPEVFRSGRVVGIDTGAVYGGWISRLGRLTAYEPFSDRVVQVK